MFFTNAVSFHSHIPYKVKAQGYPGHICDFEVFKLHPL